MLSKRITIGNNRRSTVSKKQILILILFIGLVFLSIWQIPINSKMTEITIETPKPIELK